MALGPLPHPTPHLQWWEKNTPKVMKPQTPPEVTKFSLEDDCLK